MTPCFADTSFYVALLSPRDSLHMRAIGLVGTRPARTVTTEFVLIETANFFTAPKLRPLFAALVTTIRNDPGAVVVPSTSEWYSRGLKLFLNRSDKEWSLTDCISFAVMTEFGLIDALTADHHFVQAGLAALLV